MEPSKPLYKRALSKTKQIEKPKQSSIMNYLTNKTKFKTIAFILSLALFTFTACEKDPEEPIPEPDPWTFELVDSIPGSDAGVINRVAYDSQGGIHMAYTVATGTNTSLKYAYKPLNGGWTSQEISPSLFYTEIDLAIGPDNQVYVVFEADSDESVHLAIKNKSGTFDDILVDVLGDDNHQGRFPALFADKNGVVHITFDRANYGLRYTSYTPGTGFSVAETLNDNYSGSVADLVTDDAGEIHITYHDGDIILYAHRPVNTTDWEVSEIYQTETASQSYEGINLVIDRLGNLHGAFRNGNYDNNVYYMGLEHGSTNWEFQGIGNTGGSNRTDRAIACDIDNTPHILFDQDFGLYMADLNVGWVHEFIIGNTDSRCDSNYDIQIDDNDRAHVSFHNRTTEVLYYATRVME